MIGDVPPASVERCLDETFVYQCVIKTVGIKRTGDGLVRSHVPESKNIPGDSERGKIIIDNDSGNVFSDLMSFRTFSKGVRVSVQYSGGGCKNECRLFRTLLQPKNVDNLSS